MSSVRRQRSRMSGVARSESWHSLNMFYHITKRQRETRGSKGEETYDGVASTHHDLRVVLVESTLVVTDSGHVLDDNL
jgi:hypothetical protein